MQMKRKDSPEQKLPLSTQRDIANVNSLINFKKIELVS